MKRLVIIAGVLLAGLVLLWRIEPIYMSLYAAATPTSSFESRMALIEGGAALHLPDGEGPFPVVLQFHGCAGIRPPFQAQWAGIANDAGYAALVVDSVGPRGYSREAALRAVCAGKDLIGQERAGDVLAAIEIARRNEKIDPTRIILTGWSHGAWSIMDYFTMNLHGAGPAGVTNWPRQVAGDQSIIGAILFYPYCGQGALSRVRAWRATPPVLALIAGKDTVVNAPQCISFFEEKIAGGDPVELIVYPDTEHAFDDPFIEAEWAHWHDPDAFADAKAHYANFLNEQKV